MEAQGIPPCGIEGCGFPIDIVIKSKDGGLFGTHTKHLELFNNSFPSIDSVAHRIEDVLPFEENADVVDMFLRFCHNHPSGPMDIASLGVDSAISLHKAVHRYQNYHALRACDTALNGLCLESDDNAIKILLYRTLHTLVNGPLEHLDDLIRRALTLSVRPPRTALATLLTYGRGYEGEIFAIYAIYAEKWRAIYERYQRVLSQQLRPNPSHDRLQERALRGHLEMTGHHIPAVNDLYQVESILGTLSDHDAEMYGDWYSNLYGVISAFPTWEGCSNIYKAQALRG
ncbi:hypothetical protein AAF712_008131 [Marasmius tenuissimus]|uniref:BTB domain-containing protein n=1 Tax=Marasmius tenuissimus TaxID=585030 RepID=A0ABR2ZVS0_9AGAR|nr:hypothetical protein PM082_019528 [Marasmius tenuissimus]